MTYLLCVGVSYTIFISTYPNIYDFWNVCEKNWNMWWKLIRISTAELCVECRVSERPICLVVYCFLNVFFINKMIHCYLNVDKSSKLWVLFLSYWWWHFDSDVDDDDDEFDNKNPGNSVDDSVNMLTCPDQ